MTRILITGAAGFLGSHLTRYILTETDWDVVALDRLDEAASLARLGPVTHSHPGRFRFVWHDLRAAVNPNAFGCDALRGPFDFIAHLAAGSHVDRSVSDPLGFIGDNVVGTGHLLEFARHHAPRAKLLYFSTDEVFGPAPTGVFYRPWDRHAPRNPYAASKSAGEQMAVSYAETFGLPIVVSHATNFVGEGQAVEKFLPIAMDKLMRGATIDIHAVNGVPCSRYYTHAENAASAVLRILTHGTVIDGSDRAGRYNISGEVEVSNIDLVTRLGELMGVRPRWQLIERPPGRLAPDLRYAISGEELEAIGWTRPVDFEEGLRRTIAAFAAERIAA